MDGTESHPPVPCRLLLSAVPAARVIGKGGAGIRAVRERSGAAVRVFERELPEEMRRREENVLVISSSDAEAVRDAIDGVMERIFDRSGLPDTDQRRNQSQAVVIVVPERSGSHLIGQRGSRIKSLMQETGCDLNVVKEPMAGLVEQKRVRVTASSAEEASGAICKLQDVLAELAARGVLKQDDFELREAHSAGASVRSRSQGRSSNPKEVPVRLLVSGDEAPRIVGKRGHKITKLRDLAVVQVNDAESPPFEASERFVEISAASLEQRVRVVQMILQDLAQMQEWSGGLTLLIPEAKFGSVMGHRGEGIRGIMSQTGANLKQHRAEQVGGAEYRLRLLEISGSERQCTEVVRLVHSAMEDRGAPSPSLMGIEEPPVAKVPASRSEAALLSAVSLGLSSPLPRYGGSAARASAPPPGAATGPAELELAMPSGEVARALASDDSGIARRAGVRLWAGTGSGGVPLLHVAGTAVGNAVACYLVQDKLFMLQ